MGGCKFYERGDNEGGKRRFGEVLCWDEGNERTDGRMEFLIEFLCLMRKERRKGWNYIRETHDTR